MIRIAQAASSENGTAYGTPPNQLRTRGHLDGELNVNQWYPYDWVAVFRPIDDRIADRIADLAYRIVAAGKKVGYGQQLEGYCSRYGLFDALSPMTNPDPQKIKTPVNCDCGQLVATCVYCAGVYEPNLRLLNTSKEHDLLMGTGAFIKVTNPELLKTGRGCRRGDIFWKWGHTLVCLDTDPDQAMMEPRVIGNCFACNLRDGGSTDWPSKGVLHSGDRVWLISEAATGWKQVKSDIGIGFVSPKYVCEYPRVKTTGNVWMREGPGTDQKQIMVIPYNTSVWITGEKKKIGVRDWYEVIFSGKVGWASSLYLQI